MRFLASHRRFTLVLILAYVWLLISNHMFVQSTLRTWQYDLPPGRVNAAVFWTTGALIALCSLWMLRRQGSAGRLLFAFWCGTLVLAAASYWLLIASKVEVIHFPQYALLAPLVFACSRRAGDSLLWVALAGAADEWNQYAFGHPAWPVPWDFNDMVLNVAGGAFGLVLLLSVLPLVRRKPVDGRAFWLGVLRWPAVRFTGILLAISALLLATGKMAVRSSPGHEPWITLTRASVAAGFWSFDPGGGQMRVHILEPFEGVLLILLVCAAFAHLDRRIEWQ